MNNTSNNRTPEDEKKNRLLKAALHEFAEQGYDMASTNRITKKAEVSKGLLFHYYKNKKDLYLAVLDMCINHFLFILNKELKTMPDEIFERIIAINKVKLKMSADQPLMQQLVTSAFIDPPEELKGELNSRRSELYARYIPYLYEKTDSSLFREGINRQKAVDLVIMVVNSIGDRYVQKLKDTGYNYSKTLKSLIEELESYMDLLKFGIYRQEEQL